MSWFRSAVIKAVEVGGPINITSKVRTYAGTVVHQAVVGSARIFRDRTGDRNTASFKQTMKRLEDAAISCRGIERVQLLRRWLFALQETGRAYGGSSMDNRSPEQALSSIESTSSPCNYSLNPYFDSEVGEEPTYFRDVFLYSQALERITVSMIMEAPNDDEVLLLLQIFGHCLTGGKEVHYALVKSIQDLSKAFSTYEDEVLVKREELLEFAQDSISGLKLNADIERLEYEVSKLQQKVDQMEGLQVSDEAHVVMKNTTSALVESLKEALAEIRDCCRLEALLLKRKNTNTGESLDSHSQKVDKLKVLAESLSNSFSKAEKRIIDHRIQKEDALNFRIAKANEAKGAEQDLLSDIARLENERIELQVALHKVNLALATSWTRLKKSREEKVQFDDASDQIIILLKAKEDELKNSVTSCKAEADVVQVWIQFLEDTWKLQSSHRELMDKQTSDELDKYGNCLVRSIKHHLYLCKNGLKPSIDHISTLVDNLKKFNDRQESEEISIDQIHTGSDPKTFLEEEYLAIETKISTAFSIVDRMWELFYDEMEKGSRRDDSEVSELFRSLDKMRLEFESIERPKLDIDIKALEEEKSQQSPAKVTSPPKQKSSSSPRSMDDDGELSDTASEITQLELEYSKTSPNEDFVDWDFD